MNKRVKVRKSCLLCLAFARNYAFYTASYADDGGHIVGGEPSLANQFWNTMHGNCIDIAVIEWCKIFGSERQEKHHWKRVVKDAAGYKSQLLTDRFGGSEAIWEAYRNSLLTYRDKFVAHLDEDNQYIVPYLHKAHELVISHYDYLLKYEVNDDIFNEPPPNIQEYYQKHFEMARAAYRKQNS